MAQITRILGVSLLTGVLGAGLGLVCFGHNSDYQIAVLVFACVGANVGAIAGAAREIVTALRLGPYS